MAERIELEISTQGMRAGAEEAKQILASIPKAAGQAAKDADAELKRAAASAKSFTDAMERQAHAEIAARQKQATALNNARVAAAQQNAVLQQQIAIQKQVLSGTLSLAQGQEQLAAASINAKVKNDALSASLAKSRAEFTANATAIKAMKAPVEEQVSGLGRLAGMVGSVGKLAGALGLVSVAWQAGRAAASVFMDAVVGMNATLQKAEIQFTTLLGSSDKAREHVAALFKFAAETPFETGPILQASRLLLTFGGEALATAQTLKLVGDAAAGTSQAIEEVAMWYGRAVNAIQSGRPFGEAAARLQEMGILSGDARTQMEALGKSATDTAEKTRILNSEFLRFEGQMKAQAGTWDGLTSTIKDNFGIVVAAVFRDYFTSLSEMLSKTAEFTQSDDFKYWAGVVKTAMDQGIQGIRSFIEEVKFAIGQIQGLITKVQQLQQAAITFKQSMDKEFASMDLAGAQSRVEMLTQRLDTLRAAAAGGSEQATGLIPQLEADLAKAQVQVEKATAAMAQMPGVIADGSSAMLAQGAATTAATEATKTHTAVTQAFTAEQLKAQAVASKRIETLTRQAETMGLTGKAMAEYARAETLAETGSQRMADAMYTAVLAVESKKEATKAATQATKDATKAEQDKAKAEREAAKAVKELADITALSNKIEQQAFELKKKISDASYEGLQAALAALQVAHEENTLAQASLGTKQEQEAVERAIASAKLERARATELANVKEGEQAELTRQIIELSYKERTATLVVNEAYKAKQKALADAILTMGDLRSEFNTMIGTLLEGGNLLDDMKDFGQRMGVKLIEGIAFGKKGLEDQVLIPNFSQLFGQNGTVSGIFSSGGQSAGSSFMSGFVNWITGSPSFSNVTGGGSSTASIWSNVTSGSSSAGIASGKQFGGGFMSGLDSYFGGAGGFSMAMAGTGIGMAAGAPIGGWANKKLGVGQTQQGQTGAMVGGAVGGIGGGIGGAVLLGATIGSIIPGFGTLIGAAIGAALGVIMGMIGGGALGDLFAPGRIQQEKMGMQKYFEKVFDGLNFKIMSEKAVAKGLIDYDEARDAGETLGLVFADGMGKGATQGTMIRFPGQLFANFRKMGLSVEEAKEKVLELAKAMGVDLPTAVEKINMAMDKNASGPTLLGLGITEEELEEARKNLKKYGDTSHMTIAELDALALANGNVGSTIITLSQLYAGAVDLQTGFADHAAAVAGVNGLLADKFKDVATTGGMAEETITALSEQVRNGTLSVEEALMAYNDWADSVGKARLELKDVALDAEAFDPLTGSIAEANLTLDELLTRLQEIDAMLIALAQRKIEIQVSLSQDLESIGAISPAEELGGRKAMAWANLERSRGATAHERVGTNPVTGERGGGGPTDAERMQLANDLRDYRAILVEEYGLRKAEIEQARQERLTAIDTQEKANIKDIQERYGKQRAELQKEIEAAQQQGQAEIDAAKAQGDALVEAARAQGQAEIEAARKQGQAEVEAARAQGQAEVEAARKQGQEEVEAARAAGDAIIKAEEVRAEAEMALLEKEKAALTEASTLRQEALNAEIDLLSQWRDLATSLGEQIHALITAAESPLSGPEQFGAIQRETERARQRLEGTSGAERIPAMQDLARLLGEQLSASPYQRLDPRQRELFSRLTQELTALQREAGREGAPLEDKQAQLLLLQAQSADALKSIDARIEAAQAAAEIARERAEQQANALVEAAEAAADARNAMVEAAADARNAAAEANAERRNEAAELHAQAIADAAQQQAEELLAAAEATADARNKEMQAKMDALSESEKQEIALVTARATAERALVNSEADRRQAELLTEYTNLIRGVAKEETDVINDLEAKVQADREVIIGHLRDIATNTENIDTYNQSQGEVLGRLAGALEALNTFLAGVTQAQGGMYDPQLKSNRLILAHRGETVAIGQPTRSPQAAAGASVSIGAITINGGSNLSKAEVKAAVEEAVVQSIRPQGAARAELKRQGVKFS